MIFYQCLNEGIFYGKYNDLRFIYLRIHFNDLGFYVYLYFDRYSRESFPSKKAREIFYRSNGDYIYKYAACRINSENKLMNFIIL
ncbi:hypothetical protein J18TS1_41620 [Oceanobacillus oncorhynchi subsp. incaldanensis]|uniref:Uncharacterized protein n=1 Tax=Oceanobacillus oncorhynchi TaxID=545501 RepID=A0A0A1MUK1_9BACI|nr:hypothetical protein J18TS1_41620 [Oceanobacillus oncorhynchi subsp. incaldanensis]CEI83304.1 hypothetical protein BN997_03210 [Oceanobacillus oncorhynchi]